MTSDGPSARVAQVRFVCCRETTATPPFASRSGAVIFAGRRLPALLHACSQPSSGGNRRAPEAQLGAIDGCRYAESGVVSAREYVARRR